MYTIHTSVQKEGELARSVVTNIAGDLSEVWEAHASAVKTYTGMDNTARTIDRVVSRYVDIATSKEEKHPLEEVFAQVLATAETFPRDLTPEELDEYFTVNIHDIALGMSCCVVAAVYRLWWMVRPSGKTTVKDVLSAAVLQATKGKGQRHGGDKTPFLEQPWVRLYKTHGLGFLLGQADKKYHEACDKENKEDAEREFLGAIVYLGMSLLVLEEKVK